MFREFKKYAREVEAAYNKFQRANIPPDTLIREKTILIKEIVLYIYNGDWTRVSSRDKFKMWIKNDFDYALVCKAYNTTRASLDVFIHRQDKRLENYIGEAFELIKQNRLREARTSFYTRAQYITADNQFGYRLLALLPAASLEQQFQLVDCRDEINLLHSLMKHSIEDGINSVSKEKLSYLMGLLSTDSKELLTQKKRLIDSLLSGNKA